MFHNNKNMWYEMSSDQCQKHEFKFFFLIFYFNILLISLFSFGSTSFSSLSPSEDSVSLFSLFLHVSSSFITLK